MTHRVLVADEHPVTRTGVRGALEASGAFVVCAEVATAPAAVDAALRECPDVALLDIDLPGDGVAAAGRICAALPRTAVVMLSGCVDEMRFFAALRAGARGYLPSDIDPHRLPRALEGVLSGEAALPRRLVARLIEEFCATTAADRRSGQLAELTDREWEVLRALEQGRSTAEMAGSLFVSQVTIRSHVSAILRKLGVGTRQEAVQIVLDGERPPVAH